MGVTTNYICDNNGNIVYEYSTKGETAYNRGLGGEIISAGDSYYAYNGHGDTTNLTKQSSGVALAITANYEYDAFGNCLATGGEADSNPFRYNGQYTDSETGLVYLRNRYYDPSIGRFTQEDSYWNINNMIYGDNYSNIPSYSAIMQSANLYVYCMSNPVNGSDPFGLDVYYFVNSQFADEAYYDYDDLSGFYGQPVHILVVDTADDFVREWNMMGNWNGEDVSVELVVVNMHGDPSGISPSGDSNDMVNIDDLVSKYVDDILLLNCNIGNLDHRYTNFANQLLQKNHVNSVIAADGTVCSNSYPEDGFMEYYTIGDSNFKGYLAPGYDREDEGFIKFTINENGELEWRTLTKAFYGITNIFSF